MEKFNNFGNYLDNVMAPGLTPGERLKTFWHDDPRTKRNDAIPDTSFDAEIYPSNPAMADLDTVFEGISLEDGLPLRGMTFARFLRGVEAGFKAYLPSFDMLQAGVSFPMESDPDFDAYEEIKKRELQPFYEDLIYSMNRPEFEFRLRKLQESAKWAELAAQTPALSFAASIVPDIMIRPSTALTLGTRLRNLRSISQFGAQVGKTAFIEETLFRALSSNQEDSITEILAVAGISAAAGMLFEVGVRRSPNYEFNFGDGVTEAGEGMSAKADFVDDLARWSQTYERNGGEQPTPPLIEYAQRQSDESTAGAQQAGSVPTDDEITEGNRMADAFGLEAMKGRVAPVVRITQNHAVPEVSEAGERLITIPYALKKNKSFTPTNPAVENKININWRPKQAEWRKSLDALYVQHLQEIGNKPKSPSATLNDIRSAMDGNSAAKFSKFRQLVWEDMARGHQNGPGWNPTGAVREASLATRRVYDTIIDDVLDNEMHIADLNAEIRHLSERLTREASQIGRQQIQTRIDELSESAVQRTEAIRRNKSTYVNVILDKEKIILNRDEFRSFVMAQKNISYDDAEAIIQKALGENPLDDLTGEGVEVGTARSLQERTLVDDPLAYRDWIDTDVLSSGSFYFRTMTADLELFKEFGSVNMADEIQAIKVAYGKRIAEAQTLAEKRRLTNLMDDGIEDIKAMRDMIRGTYMLPEDPDHFMARGIRIAKHWNAASMLTGAWAAVPDIARIVTADGLAKSFGTVFKALADPAIYKMGKAEANVVGEAFELVLGTRSAAWADLGEAVGSFNKLERISSEVSNQTFNVNLMNFWNEGAKSITSLVVANRIITSSMDVLAGKATQKQIEELAAGGISESMARAIARENQHFKKSGSITVGNPGAWSNKAAADAYRYALHRDVNIIVLTPGLGDRPLSMSQTLDKTLGLKDAPAFVSQNYLGLLSQFQTFMFSSMYRTVIPTLQKRDAGMLAMVVIAVGLGVIVGQLRREQNGQNNQGLWDVISDGVDRSGILGWLLEPMKSIESMARGFNLGDFTESAFGPVGTQMVGVGTVLKDFFADGYNPETSSEIRDMLPGANIAHLDGIFDSIERSMNSAAGMPEAEVP